MATEKNIWHRDVRNPGVVVTFRENAGEVPSKASTGLPILLLHTFGAKSNTERITPLRYRPVGEAMAVFATANGSPMLPDWYFNLLAHPDVDVEVGAEVVAAKARLLDGEERDTLWEMQKREWPVFDENERAAGRHIPIFLLERHHATT